MVDRLGRKERIAFVMSALIVVCLGPGQRTAIARNKRSPVDLNQALIWSLGSMFDVPPRARDLAEAFRLLRAGADPNADAEDGFRPIFHAVILQDTGLLRELLRRGAKVNVLNGDGVSPLTYAAGHANVEAVRLLVRHGADPRLRELDPASLVSTSTPAGRQILRLLHSARPSRS